MKIILGGVRGTSTVAQPEFMGYGGETTSVLVEGNAGARIIIDAGTGIGRLAQRIEKETPLPPVLMLITHYHLDHIIGLPSFSRLYRKGSIVRVATPRREGRSAEQVLPQVMAQPYWPVQMDDVMASIQFVDWRDASSAAPYVFGGLEVRWCPVHHPGGCTAYRIDEPSTGKSFVFATDVEWQQSSPQEKAAFRSLCMEPGAPDLLVFDGQFGRVDYERFKGWGHSTWEDAEDVAREVKARRLLVTHHAPQSDDACLNKLEQSVTAAMAGAGLARGGMEVVL